MGGFRRSGFQSIGVTKDWRLTNVFNDISLPTGSSFQSIGVTKDWRPPPIKVQSLKSCKSFQSIGVTKDWRPWSFGCLVDHGWVEFPINRRHQGLATFRGRVYPQANHLKFPINRRHQGLATSASSRPRLTPVSSSFQSIGVTKDWRPGSQKAFEEAYFMVSNQ